MPTTLELAARAALAFVLGGVVGLEREVDDHPAGLRTHIAVCVGAALFGMVSAYGFGEFEQPRARTNHQVDVTRIASQVVSGMGFLGGGAILKYGATVKGLTTAASLWVTAAIGLATAFGEYAMALVTTSLILASLVVLRWPASAINRRFGKRKGTLVVRLTPGSPPSSVLGALAGRSGVDAETLHVQKDERGTTVTAVVHGPPDAPIDSLVADFADRDDVAEVELG